MEREEAIDSLRKWRRERDDAREAREKAQAREIGLGKLIEGLELMFPDLETTAQPGGSARQREVGEGATYQGDLLDNPTFSITPTPKSAFTATEAVRMILSANPNRWFTGRDMMDAFEHEGYRGTETAIRLALKAATDREFADLAKNDRGKNIFRLKAESDSLTLEGSTP